MRIAAPACEAVCLAASAPPTSGEKETRWRGTSRAIAACLVLSACGVPWRAPPDLSEAWKAEELAPSSKQSAWAPPADGSSDAADGDAAEGTGGAVGGVGTYRDDRALRRAPETLPGAGTQDLPALIDVALRENPDTRAVWEAARAAASRYGQSLAPYYPTITGTAIVSPNERLLFQDSPDTLVIRQDSYDPAVTLTWTLLDFGRRAQSAEVARQQLVAANFTFNRALQTVIFRVQTAYYLLDAAQAMERAAVRNVELARTVFTSADERLGVGLATRPDVLLAKQVDARAVYELENAKVAVKNRQADLALALGIPADHPVTIESLAEQPMPEDLSEAVDELIDDAFRERPDLAAQVASLRAAEAGVERAKADFFPTIGFTGSYGQNVWDYAVQGGPRVHNNEPSYSTVFGFQWDAFRGFERLNALREAEAEEKQARAELESAELDTIAQVWRAYYDFRAAVQKLDYAEALLAASEDAYDANLSRYRHGLGTIVDLLTAERDLANARYTLVASRADVLTTASRVAYARGVIKP